MMKDDDMVKNIPDSLISQLSEFINSKMGLHFPGNRWKDLRRSMVNVAMDLALEYETDDPVACIRRLMSAPLTKKHIDILAKHLTIGETYFFRDKSLFEALKKDIFPKLITARYEDRKNIRIWSAGCCTGEEPYSLAILIDRMLSEWRKWKITLLATDLNARFLKKAEEGVYTNWSFRNTPEWIIKKYFRRIDEKHFEISPSLKKMVTFSQLNLVKNDYSQLADNIYPMDMIFCRNVLMYFEPEVREQIIGRFSRLLSENGLLIFSPSESPCIRHPNLRPVQFPGVTLYKKTSFKHLTSDKVRIREKETGPAKIRQRIVHLSQLNPQSAIRNLQPATRENKPETRQDMYKKSLTLANMGKLAEAEKYCKEAVNTEKLRPEHHYLLATIYQEQGRLRESAKSFRNAQFLLLSMKSDETLPYAEGMTAGRLLEVVRSMIKKE